ncbi:DCN1-like protein 3 [Saguinus oedipus]|uniref:DCN1-like protein 3 n=1 Tax=Saguinus oedipus TaxID=9490 RepID=A0ABQ9UX28_SAGOE|nr:DCN1-like protein 3 [Saguinus oedipus]
MACCGTWASGSKGIQSKGAHSRSWSSSIMGQCVTMCKNSSLTLCSKNGDRDHSNKSHSRRGAGHHEKQVPPCGKPGGDILINETKKAKAATEACQLPTSLEDAGRKSKSNAEESFSQRLEELFRCYKDEWEDAILEEGMEHFCNDMCVDPTEFRVLLLA